MQIHEELFVGESVSQLGTVVYSLRRDIPVFRLYCVMWLDAQKRMEIVSSRIACTQRYLKYRPLVVGVAMGYTEAIDLVRFMAQQSFFDGKDNTIPANWF